jgi:RNA polymerase sigma-70 factor (ECF subfamily)
LAQRTDDDLVQALSWVTTKLLLSSAGGTLRLSGQKIFSIVRHHEDSENAPQETLLRAYANLGRFRQACKLSTWITAIGVNAALTVIRKRKSRRE